MLFNSYLFIFLFLPLVLLGYYGLNRMGQDKLAVGYVTLMSLWFYGYGSREYLMLLLIGILVNYSLTEGMTKVSGNGTRRLLLIVGLLYHVGALFCFKYFNFFIENVNAALKAEISFWNMALPLGISFYTFQQVAYLIDIYQRDCENCTLFEYMTYIAFFPKMIQGPIAYHSEIVPWIRDRKKRQPDYENLSKGIYAFALGLAKKVLIADTLAKIASAGYGEAGYLNAPSAILVMVCYSLQIYFDFSGYCDMAMGIGYMLNVELPINFHSPYKADSIDVFWDRWHMTLTRFFTKYVYFPLGGSRKGKIRTYVNIMIIFLLSGLWHGANWTFIIWGALHGIAKVVDRIGKKWIIKLPKLLRIGMTFVFVTLAWSIFGAGSFEQVAELWGDVGSGEWGGIQPFLTDIFNELVEVKILARIGLNALFEIYPACMLLIFVAGLLIACFCMRNTQEKLQTMKLTNGKILVIMVLTIWSIVSLSDVSEFLYVNF